MTDNKIGPNIRPIAEPRPSDRPSRKHPAASKDFATLLENAKSELQSLQSQPPDKAASDATTIQAQYDVEKQNYDAVMRARQQISQAYLDIKNKPTPDKS